MVWTANRDNEELRDRQTDSVLSLTLFTIYTRDTPYGIMGTNVAYADDVTQIIRCRGLSLSTAQREVVRDTENNTTF